MERAATRSLSTGWTQKAGNSVDEIIRAISGDGGVSISVISSVNLTERARVIHGCTPVVTAALGRTLAAASMIGITLKKPGASLTVRLNGGGPAGTILVVSDNEGNVRGFVENPSADLPKSQSGKLNVGGVVGKDGMLSVIKDFAEKEPYTGAVRLVSGEIAEDFAAYFSVSEQIPSACALGVLVDRDRTVLAAGGYIVSLLPGATDELATAVESNVAKTGAVTNVLKHGGAEALLESVMSGLSPRILDRSPVGYRCTCTRERFLNALRSLDKSELSDMKAKGETVETLCQFCEAVYHFDPALL